MRQSDPVAGKQCETSPETKFVKFYTVEKSVLYWEDITIHEDIRGPFQTKTVGGKQYFLTLTTGAYRYIMVQLLMERSEALAYPLDYIACLERHTSKKLKVSYSYNEKEFIFMRTILSKIGIKITASNANNSK